MAERGVEILWTGEALGRVERAPAFVRPGIRKLMVKRARERGRTVITSEFLTEIRNESMLRVAKCIRGFGFEELSMNAFEVAKEKMRKLPRRVEVIGEIQSFLRERTEKNEAILARFASYLRTIPERGLPWTEEAMARIEKVPAVVQAGARQAIEEEARRRKEKVVTPEVVDRVCQALRPGPFRDLGAPAEGAGPPGHPGEGFTLPWTAEAQERVRRIPIPPVRRMIIQRVERYARALGAALVDEGTFQAGRDWQGR